ncbi:hypothetical protein B0H11DRAFT_2238336 [Mycena galericulata]|nr:hypothetical protein B0H11DRAFT_2260228 [Mycena galericulata]KAJ7469269.1 hypothetical protein B0H11DRAFT_2238336 [Mycena galericulata]
MDTTLLIIAALCAQSQFMSYDIAAAFPPLHLVPAFHESPARPALAGPWFTDGEGCERFWSMMPQSNLLGGLARLFTDMEIKTFRRLSKKARTERAVARIPGVRYVMLGGPE